MARSTTPTYRVEYRANQGMTPGCWNGRKDRDGRANAKNLAKHVKGYNESFKEGGVNAHLAGLVISSAKLIRQSTGEVVAEYGGN